MSRRSLAGSLCVLGLILASVALSCAWIQYALLSPERTVRVTQAALDSPEVQDVLARRLAGGLAQTLPGDLVTPEQLEGTARSVLATPAVRSEIADALVVSHQHALGATSEQPRIDGPEVTEAVALSVESYSPPLASSVRSSGVSVPLPVRPLPGITLFQSSISWLQGITFPLSLVLIASAFLLHPRRYVLARLVGWWLLTMSALPVALLWALPSLILPMLDSWMSVLAATLLTEIGKGILPLLIILAVLGVGGVILARFWKLASDRHYATKNRS